MESISKARFGTTSGWYSFALSELARAEKQLGKYAEAAEHCKRVLAIYEKVFGPSHQNVATALTNPAILHEHEGKYAEAADLTRRAPRMPAPGGRMPRRGRIPLISKS